MENAICRGKFHCNHKPQGKNKESGTKQRGEFEIGSSTGKMKAAPVAPIREIAVTAPTREPRTCVAKS